MDFGILTEGALTGGTESFQERYHKVLAEAKLADQVGFDVFGTSEQHFTAPFSAGRSSPPLGSASVIVVE